ncbi:MAG TPA: ATP-binding protein [Candidatus Binatia bacterium]|nr:ATP-binding protein [Candidatus Binatia bacterium]
MRILVVEDDERLCEVFREYLEEIGHEPLIVHTIDAARDALQHARPGAMLLDIRLPGMSGLEFLQLQSTKALGVPIVVMSGMLTEDEAHDCLRLGAVDYLGKPIALEHLRDILLCLEPLTEPGAAPTPARPSERRAAPRARVALPVRVAEYGGNGWDATTVDLSMSGVKIRTNGAVTPAAVSKISLPVGEGQRTFQVISVLVRADVDGYAFHFINLADWQQDQLRSFVDRNLEPPPPPAEPHARVLRSITQAFNGTLDLEETLRLALHALTHVTGHEVSSLHLLSPDRRTLHLRGERGLSPRLREINRVLPVGEGLIGRVAATGQTARISEVKASPELLATARPIVEEEDIRGFVCVPLQTRGRIVGTLSLGRAAPAPFSDSEVALVEATANQLALALDNARLYSETRRQLDDLQAADAEGERRSTVGKLAAGLVHEINNPLTAILGQAHLLMGEAEASPAGRERLRVIIQETSRAARLLKSVQGLSRPRRVERQACALDEEVRAVLDLTQPQRDCDGIRTVMELDAVSAVWADPDQVRQVLLNLVQNAQQALATHAGERLITVRTRPGVDRALVEVQDTGPGIDEDVLPRIFDAFFTTKPAGEGTGLGLWVSYDIAEQHGGRLYACNRPGGGAVFTLELPLRKT